ncbi:cytoskeleton-associated protein 4 [Salminus brasiliensis]|uniref:cytoskeleton-associated protein 4 n=1 Tax=Salminus brasiliensis TaxID=930266 RepID=UPI003B834D05
MAAKNRNKNATASEKSPTNPQDDVAKKSPKVSKADSTPVPSCGSGSGKLLKFVSGLCYLVLVAGAGFASFYLQQVLTEVNRISARNEESMQKSAAVVQKVEQALLQVNSMKSSLDSLEASVGRAQVELEATNRAVRKGETETRRVEEVLQKLQNEILRDLSNGIREVKEARENDFSSLERTLEDRLAELSRSIADSVAEFTSAQGEAQAQLSELKGRLEDHSDPSLLKHELTSITTTVADLHTANEVAEGNMGVLREQIASVRAELQTRNKEVASLSEEIESVRSLVQSTAGSLRQEVSTAQASVQGMADRIQSLQDGQDRSSESLQSLETELRRDLAKAEKTSDDLEIRMKAAEDSAEALASSTTEQASRLEALLAKYDSYESSLAAQGSATEKAGRAQKEELEVLKSSVVELQNSIGSLDNAYARIETVEQRLDALGDEVAVEEPVSQTEELESHQEEEVGEEATENQESVNEEVVEEEAAAEEEEAEEEPATEKEEVEEEAVEEERQ